MKKILAPVLALSMLAGPLAAEGSPLQMAERLDACDGREVISARMSDDGKLAVRCAAAETRVSTQGEAAAAGSAGGLGIAAPLIGLGAIGLGVAALAGGSSSSDTQ